MGPLAGLKVIEFEGIGPGPLAGMILADMGAQVTVIRRLAGIGLQKQLGQGADSILLRGKQALAIDLKRPEGVALALKMLGQADALIEGNRPGVMERLGLGPAECLLHNPRLIYGRMTGWGQEGPLAQVAGHDLNYVALSGLLGLGREGETPARVPPTLLGDATGALGLAFGIVAAAYEARNSGQGQVVDAAIVDIVAMLGSIAHWVMAAGQLGGTAPSPFYDSPFYDVYQCADGQWITLGALEPQFYALLLSKLGLDDVPAQKQYDHAAWPALKQRLTALFKSEPQAHWCALLEGSDVCFAPVLSPAQAARHPHNRARGNFLTEGVLQARAAPRFSRTVVGSAPAPGLTQTPSLLAALQLDEAELSRLRAAGVLA